LFLGRVKRVTRHYEMSCSAIETSENPTGKKPPAILANLAPKPPKCGLGAKKATVSAGRKLFDKIFARRDSQNVAEPSCSSLPKTKLQYASATHWYESYSNPRYTVAATTSKTDRLPRRLIFNNHKNHRGFWQSASSTDDVTRQSTNDDVTSRWRQKSPRQKIVLSLVDVFEQSNGQKSGGGFLAPKTDGAKMARFRRVESIARIPPWRWRHQSIILVFSSRLLWIYLLLWILCKCFTKTGFFTVWDEKLIFG